LYKKRIPSPNLALGRGKGTNHLNGIPKSKESNLKRSESHKKWSAENPEKIKERGEKTRSENHYKWKGGATILNQSIRRMTENRKWAEAVRKRDGACVRCGTNENLEADHIISLAVLIERYRVKTRDDTRQIPAFWDINNGRTLCAKCHCKKDNRAYSPTGSGKRRKQ